MKKPLLVGAALLAMILAFVVGKQWYQAGQAKAVAQVAAAPGSPFDRPDAPLIGTVMARVEIVEFLDPACEGCRAFHPYIKAVLAEHPAQVRLSLRYATLHTGSDYVAQVLEAARLQGQEIFIAALDAAFASQPVWASHGRPQPERIWEALQNTGLDIARARREMNDPQILARLRRDAEDMRTLSVRQTPTLFINRQPLREFSPEGLARQVAEELRRTKP